MPAQNDIVPVAHGQKKEFIRSVIPFSFLPEEELDSIADELSLVSYAKQTRLFIQGESHVEHLYIVKRGAVERYFDDAGEKTLRGMLGEGEIYGGISMLVNEGISIRSIQIKEDTRFYILGKDVFLRLCSEYKGFSEFFTDTFGKRMIDRSYAAILKKTAGGQEESSQFFNLQVRNIFHAGLLSCSLDTSIQSAAERMTRNRCSSIFITTPDGSFSGVVTDNDLRAKVTAKGYDIKRPVSDIMSSPLHCIPATAMVSEALLKMMEENLKHLAVTDMHGQIIGVVTNRDLLAVQGQSPFFIIREINTAASINEMIDKQRRVPRLVRHMINSGAKSRTVTRLITAISDGILKKMIEFALKELGPAPVSFAFIVMGSEGRKEQTLKTDQDNAIIYEDMAPGELRQVRDYFLRLGERVCGWLDQAGYSFCKGDIMAKNPKWCQPLSKWKEYFHTWIRVSTGEDLLSATIFFDFRGAFGNPELVDDLRLSLFESLSGWTRFSRDLAEISLSFKPPIGFFRNFLVESKGKHRHEFDIKNAMVPIVDFARIYALSNGIAETNTQERLYRLYLDKKLREDVYMELDQAYNYLLQQRLIFQIDAVEKGEPPANYINPKKLSRLEQTMLKEIFKRIEGLQTRLRLDYMGGV